MTVLSLLTTAAVKGMSIESVDFYMGVGLHTCLGSTLTELPQPPCAGISNQ